MEIQYKNNEVLGEEMQFAVHTSGLRVYVFPKKGFSKYYAIYGTEYGSVDREFIVPGDTEKTIVPDGIAHYLEHKMFEEEDGGNAFDRFAETGASSNAFTSFDMTAYLFTCTDKFYENLDILLDFVNHPYFTEENVAKEQGIIGQEIKMYDDDPEWRVFFNALEAMFHNNPVKIDIAGTVESISHITPEVLYSCYRTFYNPLNMALVLVGDVSMEEAMQYVDKHVEAGRALGKVERPIADEPKERVREYVEQKLVVSQPMFRIGFKDNRPGETGEVLLKKEIATEIAVEALAGKSSPLYMELYENGLIDASFGTEVDTERLYGFTLFGGESKDPQAVYDRVKKEIRSCQKEGLPKDAVERAKKCMVSAGIRLFNNVESMGNAFLRRVMNGSDPLGYAEMVGAVSYEDVMERFCEHFDTENCVLSVIRPAE